MRKLPSQIEQFFYEAPLVKVIIPLCFGIFTQLHINFIQNTYSIALIGTFLLLYFLLQRLSDKVFFRIHEWNGVLLQLITFGIGIFITQLADTTKASDYYAQKLQNSNAVSIRLLENPLKKAGSFKALAEVNYIDDIVVSGKAIVYFDKKTFTNNLIYGDVLYVPNHFVAIKNSGNPGCYDYQNACKLQGVTHQIFLKVNEYHKNGNAANLFWTMLWKARDEILRILEENISSEKELGVAEALLIGYRDNLDKDLQQVYSNTGIVHVLAISGMHLGLIFWLLNKILFLLDKSRKTRWIKSIIVLTIIWVFSLLTGASGSIMRAAVMFTFLQFAGLINHKTSIYNTLAASALFMLAIDPFTLADVGFQLSYIAVIGIVALQKYIQNWVFIKNKWLQKVWNLVAVSIAAQTATFPICMLYFHQFPNYFLLANLIAIPLSTIVLFGEIGLIAFSIFKMTFIAKYIGLITCWLISLMNSGVAWVDALPGAVLNGFQFHPLQITLLYGFLFSAIVWLIGKKIKFLKISLMLLLVFISWRTLDDYFVSKQNKLIVYAIPHGSAIDLAQSNNYLSFKDSVLQSNHIAQNFHLKPARILFGLNKEHNTEHDFYFTQLNKKILYIADMQQLQCFDELKDSVDVVIVAHNAIKNIQSLTQRITFGELVFDSSNSSYKIKKWQTEAEKLGINVWSTEQQGALVMDL